MFYSPPPYHDLIFQDATRKLQVVDPKLRWYDDYLGADFMRAKRITDCHAGATSISHIKISKLVLLTFMVLMGPHTLKNNMS